MHLLLQILLLVVWGFVIHFLNFELGLIPRVAGLHNDVIAVILVIIPSLVFLYNLFCSIKKQLKQMKISTYKEKTLNTKYQKFNKVEKESKEPVWQKWLLICLLIIIILAFCEALEITSFTRNSTPDEIHINNNSQWERPNTNSGRYQPSFGESSKYDDDEYNEKRMRELQNSTNRADQANYRKHRDRLGK